MRIDEISNIESKIRLVLDNIIIECRDFCRDMQETHTFLYRGIENLAKSYFTGDSPINRNPRGQSQDQQWALDKILSLNGFRALRNNSISCTPDVRKAKRWGVGKYETYIIFPHNGFDFTWSQYINDIGSEYRIVDQLEIFNDSPKELKDKIAHDFVNEWKFRSSDMDSALISGHEIAIHGKYTAINIRFAPIVKKYFTEILIN